MVRVLHAVLIWLLDVLLSPASLVRIKRGLLLVTILHVHGVVPVPKLIPEQVLGQQRVLLVPLVCIRCRRMLLHVRPAVPDPLQIPEPVLGQHRVLSVPLVCIHHPRTLRRVQPVPPLPTPPLSYAPLVPIKK
jgi:hypothetical protein